MLKSRAVMFTVASVWVALLFVLMVFRGGGAVPRLVGEPPSQPTVRSLAQQAGARADLGEYEGAWRLYYEALQAAPEDVSLWYGLGVTLSRLGQRKETEEAFRYVVGHGKADSEEVKNARRWLVSAGVLAEPVAFGAPPEEESVESEKADARGEKAALKGKVTWGEIAASRPSPKIRVLVHGLRGPAEGKRFSTQVALAGVYRFEHLPAGSYRLIGRAGDRLVWDLTLTVEDGKEITLDLGRDNSRDPSADVFV